jgi:hypothetical protein
MKVCIKEGKMKEKKETGHRTKEAKNELTAMFLLRAEGRGGAFSFF